MDLNELKSLYKRIYKDNNYDKNNIFILPLCILLISKILNVNEIHMLIIIYQSSFPSSNCG